MKALILCVFALFLGVEAASAQANKDSLSITAPSLLPKAKKKHFLFISFTSSPDTQAPTVQAQSIMFQHDDDPFLEHSPEKIEKIFKLGILSYVGRNYNNMTYTFQTICYGGGIKFRFP